MMSTFAFSKLLLCCCYYCASMRLPLEALLALLSVFRCVKLLFTWIFEVFVDPPLYLDWAGPGVWCDCCAAKA